MKKYFILTFVIAIFFSCAEQKNEGFQIEGKLIRSAGESVFLDELTPTSVQTVDTVVIDQYGKFEFSQKISEPKFYIVRVDKKNFVSLLVAPNDKLTISGDVKDLPNTYHIEGSDDSKLLEDLHYQLNTTLVKIDSLGLVYSQNKVNPKLDSIKEYLDISYNQIVADFRTYSINFVQKNCSSLAAILALSQQLDPQNYIFDPLKDMKYFKLVDDTLMTIYPNHEQVKSFHQFVSDILKQGSPLDIGMVAPAIAMRSPEDLVVSLTSLRGKYVLVDFWASWCKPCRAENPNLVRNFVKYHKLGLEIYQVSLDKTRDEWVTAIKADNLTWWHVSDLKFWDSETAKQYQVQAIPANFLLDKEGKIIAKNLRGAELGNKLQEIFQQ